MQCVTLRCRGSCSNPTNCCVGGVALNSCVSNLSAAREAILGTTRRVGYTLHHADDVEKRTPLEDELG